MVFVSKFKKYLDKSYRLIMDLIFGSDGLCSLRGINSGAFLPLTATLQRHMIRFKNPSSAAKARAAQNVVVEVKHPRKLNKANSIWGDIDLGKHTEDVLHLLPGAPEAAQADSILRVKPSAEVEIQTHAARILEDRQQAADLEAKKEALLAVDPDAEPSEEELALIESLVPTEVVAEADTEEEPLAATVEEEVVAAEAEPQPETVVAASEEAVEVSAVPEVVTAETEPAVVADPVVEEAPVFAAVSEQQADSLIDPLSAPSEKTDADGEDVDEDEDEDESALSSDDALVAAETQEDDLEDEEFEEAVERPSSPALGHIVPPLRLKKIPGVRYVRRNGELQVARGDRWKVKRMPKSARA